ncbi:transcription factor [Fusarium beomiforme]|uniref:Transcription factor n=1 Tax=Fusarium beomiforme TaxID=44412 RepID=A0A9P5ALX6_9HYPO|nr:transcription factor [Fusarium beomiforme]
MGENTSLDEEHPLADSAPAVDSAPAPKRRKLRKGTVSCWEYCVSQESEKPPEVGSNKHIVDRLGEVEALVQHLLKNSQHERRSQDGLVSPSSSVSRRRSEDRPRCSKSPAVTTTNDTSPNDTSAAIHPIELTPRSEESPPYRAPEDPGPYDAVNRTLISAWPSPEDMKIIMSVPVESSQIIRAMTCAPSKDRGSRLPSPSSLLRLPPRGSHPVLVARKMLVLATFLQGTLISSEKYLEKLSISYEKIMARIVKVAHDHVTCNDDLVSSLEGIECIMLEGLYENYSGRLRRSWLAARRAVMIAQILGLNKGIVPLSVRGATVEPDDLWFRVINLDRYLCLMLGLPPSAPDEPSGNLDVLDSYSANRKMQHLCSIACNRLLSRRASDVFDQSLTREIDKLLRDACTTMPAQWWTMPNLSSYYDLPDKIRETLRFNDHFMQYHLLLQLHMPYLMKVDSGEDWKYNKLTAVTASREILTRFVSVRTIPQSRYHCRGTDLVAFISCTALTIAHILCDERHKRIEEHGFHFLAQQRLSDRGLIEQVLKIAQDGLRGQNGDIDDISKRLITLLHYLLAIEDNVTAGVRYSVSFAEESMKDGDLGHHVKASEDGTVLDIHLPHLPVIKIVRRDPYGKEKPPAVMEVPWGNIILEQPGPRNASGDALADPIPSSTHEVREGDNGRPDLDELCTLQDNQVTDSWALEGLDMSFLDTWVEGPVFV